MASVRDDVPGVKERRTSKNLRLEYTTFINQDAGLLEARRWIERITFTPFKTDDFRESLVDGVLLCELIVNVASISIGRINRSSTQYASTDNLKLFHRACQELDFDSSQLFDVSDLQEVAVKRGQNVIDRARESQRRLSKVVLTVYWLGKYANDNLNFTGSSSLDESCFQHLVENKLPELPELEGADITRRNSQFEPSQSVLTESNKETLKDKDEIVTETADFGTKREAFKKLEDESKKVEEEAAKRRRRSFSSFDKENNWSEDLKDRRKSFGTKPVWKEGDSKNKHKKEILGGLRDPVKNRRERIAQKSVEASTTQSKPPVALGMRSPVDLKEKKSRYEAMERQASEDSDVLQSKRTRTKSWSAGEFKARGASLKDKTNKFEGLQKQADKERAVLHGELRMPAVDNDVQKPKRAPVIKKVNLKEKHNQFEKLDKAAQQQTLVLEGKHRQAETSFEYDIGDKVSGPISLPGAVDVKLKDKKRQFESLDYQAQRESTILMLHSGKSFDNPDAVQLRSGRSQSMPRPKSNVYDYQRTNGDVEMRDAEGGAIRSSTMEFNESTPHDSLEYNSLPMAPPRADSLRYTSTRMHRRPEEVIRKDSKKVELYSSFAPREDPKDSKEKKKGQDMKYKEFVPHPVIKQRDRVERYNAAIHELSKEPESKQPEAPGGRPRKKSIGNDEWIKVKPMEELNDDLPKRPISKLWDREPEPEEGEPRQRPVEPVDMSFSAVQNSTYVPNVRNMKYKDFAAPPKSIAKDQLVMARAPVFEGSGQGNGNGNRSEPFNNFTQKSTQASNDKRPKGMSYRDFAVPPPKGETTTKAKKVQDLTRKFMEIEAEQFKPKEGGPPQLKSLVNREELVRYERESRAHSWYGGPLGLDDEEFEGAYRRRVRRWSDYDYEEGAPTREMPHDHHDQDEAQNQEHHDFLPSPPEEFKPYTKNVEPEIEMKANSQVESSREWDEPSQPRPEPSYHAVVPRDDPKPQTFEEDLHSKPQNTKPLRSILKHEALSADQYNEPPLPKTEPVPEPKQQYPPESRVTVETQIREQPRPISTNIRNIGSRSWNDFDSSRRKKSLELIENRPLVKSYETRDQVTVKADGELYKLKRPADYLPKFQPDQALSHKPQSEPAYPQKKTEEETYHHEVKPHPQDDYAPHKNESAHAPEYHQDRMPTSYPTYYMSHNTQNAPQAVESEKPLFVSAKLHEDKKDLEPVYKPSDQGYDFVASDNLNFTESQPDLESSPPPTVDFKTQQRLWEDLSSPKSITDEEQDPVRPEKLQVKELQIEKQILKPQPEIKQFTLDPNIEATQRNVSERQVNRAEEFPVEAAPKSSRPQVFAIVGQGKQVRPMLTELPKLKTVLQEQDVVKTEIKHQPHEAVHKEEPSVQEKPKSPYSRTAFSPSLSGAKVFDFGMEGKPSAVDYKQTQKHEIIDAKNVPLPKDKKKIVMETVSVVEAKREFDEDIFKALEEETAVDEDEKISRNLKDPEYREKLRKEVEEQNRKQREDTKYLTNLHLRQSLGSSQENMPAEENVRLQHVESLETTSGKMDDMFDYNANKNDKNIDRRYLERRDDDPRLIQMNGTHDDRYNRDQKKDERHHEDRRNEHRYDRHDHDQRGRGQQGYPNPGRDRYEEHRYKDERKDADVRRHEQQRRPQQRYEDERGRKDRERIENERREHERREHERRDHERRQPERREHERREHERIDNERREHERREHERKKHERKEHERREHGRIEQERIENERREHERKEHERREHERREHGRIEQERIENERKEHERREHERREYERKEHGRLEQERIENERKEHERREYERLEKDQHYEREQERLRQERLEQERQEHTRREQQQIERERMERERLDKERHEKERYEREQQQQQELARRDQERKEHERREKQRLEQERYEREQQQQEHTRKDQERKEHERREKQRLEQERYERDHREQERRDRHRKEQEQLDEKQKQQQRLEQQRRVHEMLEQQQEQERSQEQEYKEILSKEQHQFYVTNEPRAQKKEDGIKWNKIEDGSGYGIFETFIQGDRNHVVCSSCEIPVMREKAIFVTELNRYWHERCFRCVVCHIIFGSHEQRSPLKVTSSLLHCENCFITNEGEKCTEV